MKDAKIEIPIEENVQLMKEDKIKIIKEEQPLIEEDKNKNGFSDCGNISGKDLNYEGQKENVKIYDKNNNKRNIINIAKNKYLTMIMIFFNLIIPNYKSSEITLKIRESGNQNIFSSSFGRDKYPESIIINGNPGSLTTNQ